MFPMPIVELAMFRPRTAPAAISTLWIEPLTISPPVTAAAS